MRLASGFSGTERVQKAQKLGAEQYLKKPVTVKKMGRTIKAVLVK